MKILVLNCGGSSFKYQLLDMTQEVVLARGGLDRMGSDDAVLVHRVGDETRLQGPTSVRGFTDGIRFVVDRLIQDRVVSGVSDISAVAHKLAHGGELFSGTVRIDDEVLAALRQLGALAPVHNPPNIRGIEVCRDLLPGVPQIGSFETAFHRTVPAKAYTYGVPHEWYERYGVRKYGFHGASHSYVAQRVAHMVGRRAKDLRTVSCHLGSGTAARTAPTSPRTATLTNPPPIWCQPTRVTLAAFTIASAASITATSPFVSISPNASPIKKTSPRYL
jgi:acetate kinase